MKLFSEAVEEVEYICEEKEDGKKSEKRMRSMEDKIDKVR